MSEYEITPDMAGTWLDGHMGWQNVVRVVTLAEEFGMTVTVDDRSVMEAFADDSCTFIRTIGYGTVAVVDYMYELSDHATEYLELLAPAGYAFEWDCGEFALIELPDEAMSECPATVAELFALMDGSK